MWLSLKGSKTCTLRKQVQAREAMQWLRVGMHTRPCVQCDGLYIQCSVWVGGERRAK